MRLCRNRRRRRPPKESSFVVALRRYIPTGIVTAYLSFLTLLLNAAKDDEGTITCRSTHRALLYTMIAIGVLFAYVLTRYESLYVKTPRSGFPALASVVAFAVVACFNPSAISCLYPSLRWELAVAIPIAVAALFTLVNGGIELKAYRNREE